MAVSFSPKGLSAAPRDQDPKTVTTGVERVEILVGCVLPWAVGDVQDSTLIAVPPDRCPASSSTLYPTSESSSRPTTTSSPPPTWGPGLADATGTLRALYCQCKGDRLRALR